MLTGGSRTMRVIRGGDSWDGPVLYRATVGWDLLGLHRDPYIETK